MGRNDDALLCIDPALFSYTSLHPHTYSAERQSSLVLHSTAPTTIARNTLPQHNTLCPGYPPLLPSTAPTSHPTPDFHTTTHYTPRAHLTWISRCICMGMGMLMLMGCRSRRGEVRQVVASGWQVRKRAVIFDCKRCTVTVATMPVNLITDNEDVRESIFPLGARPSAMRAGTQASSCPRLVLD